MAVAAHSTSAGLNLRDRLMQPRVGGVILFALLLALLPLVFPSGFWFRVATLICIQALAVVGLNLLMGYAGQISLGHAGFFGIGAYAVAVGPAHVGGSPLLWVPVGIALALALAALVGRPILRLKGHALAVATLGLGILITMVLTNEAAWTGGPDGMGLPRAEVFGVRLRGARLWYGISAAVLVLGVWLALNLVDSRTGRALRALHDSDVAARTLGVDVARLKLVAFVISAGYAAAAGGLLGLYNAFVTPDVAGFLHSVEFVTMAVLGGLGSVFGSVVGAAVLVALPQLLTAFAEYEHLLLGLVLMVVMIVMPAGLVPTLARRLRRS